MNKNKKIFIIIVSTLIIILVSCFLSLLFLISLNKNILSRSNNFHINVSNNKKEEIYDKVFNDDIFDDFVNDDNYEDFDDEYYNNFTTSEFYLEKNDNSNNNLDTKNFDNIDDNSLLNKEIELSNINKISLDIDIADISVQSYEGEKLILEYSPNMQEKITINKNFSNLKILSHNFKHSKNNFIINLKIPNTYREVFEINQDVGNLYFNSSAKYLDIDNDLGNITVLGDIISSNIEVSSGNIDFYLGNINLGKHDLTVDLGNVDLHLQENSNLNLFATLDAGIINNNFNFNSSHTYLINKFNTLKIQNNNSNIYINIENDLGNININ